MGQSTFDGPIISKNGMYTTGPGSVVNIPDGTNNITLTVAAHAGRIIKTNDATLNITLPTISAAADSPYAGPGADPNNPNNQGATFTIVVETTATALAIKTDGTDKYVGSVTLIDTDSSGAMFGYAPSASNDVINLDGGNKGGLAGSVVVISALASAKYMVTGTLLGTGTPTTPFADT